MFYGGRGQVGKDLDRLFGLFFFWEFGFVFESMWIVFGLLLSGPTIFCSFQILQESIFKKHLVKKLNLFQVGPMGIKKWKFCFFVLIWFSQLRSSTYLNSAYWNASVGKINNVENRQKTIQKINSWSLLDTKIGSGAGLRATFKFLTEQRDLFVMICIRNTYLIWFVDTISWN